MAFDESKRRCRDCGVTIAAEDRGLCVECLGWDTPKTPTPRPKEKHPEYEGFGNEGGTQDGWDQWP